MSAPVDLEDVIFGKDHPKFETKAEEDKERNMIKRGICYKKSYCEHCHRNINEKENRLILFRCGHKMHKNCCLIRNNIYLCSICFNKELNESLSLSNFENLLVGLAKDKNKLNSRYRRKEKIKNNKNEEGNVNDFEGSKNSLINMNINEIKKNETKKKYNKLNMINQRSVNNVDLMDINVDIVRRNKRK